MSTSAPTARKCQRSRGLAASQASDASAPGDARAHDRRLPADSEDVDGDGDEDRELAPRPPQPHQPAEAVDPRGEEGDVLARDREQVVQPRCPEVVLHPSREALVLAEDDTEHDAAADALRAAPDGALDAVAERVTDSGDPAAPPDLAPARRLEHDVDALARQPGALVEAVLLRPRLRDANRRLDDGTARWRAADGEHEQGRARSAARV